MMPRSRRRRWAWPAVLALALAGRAGGQAHAHANLVRSEPAVGSTAPSAPEALVLVFSETLDTRYSRVKLIDSRGRVVDEGPGTVDAADPHILRLALGDLPEDSYVAEWRNRSTVDGHIRAGIVPFGVGVAADPTALLPPLGAPDPLTAPPPLAETVLRWLGLVGLALAGGGATFALWVWRPAHAAAAPSHGGAGAADLAMTAFVRRQVLVGGAVVAVAAVLRMFQQAAADADASASALAASLAALAGSRSGAMAVARAGCGLGLAWQARRLPAAGSGPHRPWAVAAGLAAAAVLTVATSGHGAASPTLPVLAIAADALHVGAMAAWLGGLVPLAAALRAARRDPAASLPLASLVPRFSRLATASVVVLSATGSAAYALHVGSKDLLATTTYGRALAVKLVLFGVLLGLAAHHRFRLSPRLARAGQALAAAFGRGVAAEVAAGALVLAAVGAMTSVTPSRDAAEARARSGVIDHVALPAGELTLRVMPGLVGNNAVAVELADTRPAAAGTAADAVLRVTAPGGVARPFDVTLRPAGAAAGRERFVAHGSFFTPPGTWRTEVIVRRRGLDDVRHAFAARITRTPDERIEQRVDDALAAPIPSSAASIAAGAALFQTHCAPCHGPEGRGDGVAAAGLATKPADFRLHVALHTDAELYAWVALGIEDTPMPAFRDTLDRDELWHVVNHLRATFGAGIGSGAGGAPDGG